MQSMVTTAILRPVSIPNSNTIILRTCSNIVFQHFFRKSNITRDISVQRASWSGRAGPVHFGLVIDSEALHESESNLRNRKRFEFVSESNPESVAQTFWDRNRNRYRKLFITNIGIGTDTGIGSEVDNFFPF